MKTLRLILSGEFLIALYLVVGSYKSALNIPLIDETLLLLLITLAISLKRLYVNKMSIPKIHVLPLLIFALLITFAVVSLLYSPSTIYAYDKLVRFSVIAAWCYVGVFFFFKNEESIKRFLWGFVFLSLIMGLNTITSGVSTDVGFQSAFGSSYVALARVTAMGSLILLMYFVFSDVNKIKKILLLATSLLLFVPLIQSGARLPIALFSLVLLTIPLSMVHFRKRDIFISKRLLPLILLFISVVSAFAFYVNQGYAETLLYRFDVLANQQGGGDSLTGRTDRFETAWEMSKESYFMGQGLGSFPIYYSGLDAEDYPHSIYLELLSELGLFPLMLFISLLVLAVINGFKYYKKYGLNPLNTSVYAMFLFWLFNSFGSSSMTGDKVFYALIAIMIIMPYLGHVSEEEKKKELNPINSNKRKRYKLTW